MPGIRNGLPHFVSQSDISYVMHDLLSTNA